MEDYLKARLQSVSKKGVALNNWRSPAYRKVTRSKKSKKKKKTYTGMNSKINNMHLDNFMATLKVYP